MKIAMTDLTKFNNPANRWPKPHRVASIIAHLAVSETNVLRELVRTPMLAAAYDGDVKTVKAFLDAGEDVNQRDHWGNPMLNVAASLWVDYEMVILLMSYGADVNMVNSWGHGLKDLFLNDTLTTYFKEHGLKL